MSTVRANWHVDLAEVPGGDPFGERARVEHIGRPVQLDDEARLLERLDGAVTREGALDAQGITCAIKDDPQATCSACPISHMDPLDPLSPLCAIGMEQESLITRLRILAVNEQQPD